MPLLVSGATHAAAGHPRSGGRSEGFLLFPVLPKTFFFKYPFKAIRFFSLFPLLSSSTPRPALGALPSRGPAPGRTLRPSSFQPGVAGPRSSGGGCWTKGGGAAGRGGGAHATSAVPAAHTPPPLAGPTLFRTAGCACWVGARTRFLRPLCCGEGPDGFSQVLQVPSPLPSLSWALPSRSSQQRCPSRGN